MKSLARTLLFLFVLAAAFFSLLLAYTDYAAKSKHASWPRAEATVSSAKIDRNPKGWHCPDVKATFSQGPTAVTATVRFQDPVCTPTAEAAKEKLHGYAIGQQVSIYYDPAKPTTAIAKPMSLGLMFYFGVIFGPLFLILAFRVRKGN